MVSIVTQKVGCYEHGARCLRVHTMPGLVFKSFCGWVGFTAYETYCEELKALLKLTESENTKLKGQLRNTDEEQEQPTMELFNTMTSLSICCIHNSKSAQRYSCSLVDGLLKGEDICT